MSVESRNSVNIRLERDLWEKAKKRAAEERRTIQEVINRTLRNAISNFGWDTFE